MTNRTGFLKGTLTLLGLALVSVAFADDPPAIDYAPVPCTEAGKALSLCAAGGAAISRRAFGEKSLKVKEYPAQTMEDAIIAAVMAERDGALAVVCAPIIAPTIEKLLAIPVSIVSTSTPVRRSTMKNMRL